MITWEWDNLLTPFRGMICGNASRSGRKAVAAGSGWEFDRSCARHRQPCSGTALLETGLANVELARAIDYVFGTPCPLCCSRRTAASSGDRGGRESRVRHPGPVDGGVHEANVYKATGCRPRSRGTGPP